MQSANKVLLNTAIIYGRMLITIGISLYSTRLILNSLGNTDFGIFNLISSIIIIFSFLNSAMSSSTQRFLSYYQGQNNTEHQENVFKSSLIIHLAIAVLVIILLELAGLFIFDNFLNIPITRLSASKILFHYVVISTFFTIISTPFIASLIAHENMITFSIISLIETFLKLGSALLLLVITRDKLIVYGALVCTSNFIIFIIYSIYCSKKYVECTYNRFLKINKKLFKEIASFASWNLFGSICGVCKDQGLALLLNIYNGPLANTAYGIGITVSSQLIFFSSTLLRVITPQIVKSEGFGDRNRMLKLSMIASKFGFFLLAFIAIPFIFEIDSILKLWLGHIPEFAKMFCILLIIAILVNHLTIGLQIAFQASGKIKSYQIIVGTIILTNLPISYLLLQYNYPIYYPLIAFIAIELIACTFRIILLQKTVGLTISEFITRVLGKEIAPILTILFSCLLITNYLHFDFRLLLTFTLSILTFAISIYFTGLCSDERKLLQHTLADATKWLQKRNIIHKTFTAL